MFCHCAPVGWDSVFHVEPKWQRNQSVKHVWCQFWQFQPEWCLGWQAETLKVTPEFSLGDCWSLRGQQQLCLVYPHDKDTHTHTRSVYKSDKSIRNTKISHKYGNNIQSSIGLYPPGCLHRFLYPVNVLSVPYCFCIICHSWGGSYFWPFLFFFYVPWAMSFFLCVRSCSSVHLTSCCNCNSTL